MPTETVDPIGLIGRWTEITASAQIVADNWDIVGWARQSKKTIIRFEMSEAVYCQGSVLHFVGGEGPRCEGIIDANIARWDPGSVQPPPSSGGEMLWHGAYASAFREEYPEAWAGFTGLLFGAYGFWWSVAASAVVHLNEQLKRAEADWRFKMKWHVTCQCDDKTGEWEVRVRFSGIEGGQVTGRWGQAESHNWRAEFEHSP